MSGFENLQALNVAICRESGAGKGHGTTREAARTYNALLRRDADKVHAAIMAARAEMDSYSRGGSRRHFIDGIESALYYALSEAGEWQAFCERNGVRL